MIPSDIVDRYGNLSCEDVAERLGIDVQRHKARCFMHDDHNPSLSFYGRNRNRWHCFVCDKGGNAITLVQEYYKCSFVDACSWLGKNYGGWTERPSAHVRKAMPKTFKVQSDVETTLFSPEIAQAIIDKCCLNQIGEKFLVKERKYDISVINSLHIVSIEDADELMSKLQTIFGENALLESGLCTRTNKKIYLRLFTPCLVFPYYDEQKKIVGIQSRYLGTQKRVPRFQFISGQKTRVFNLPIIQTLQPGDNLYISEGVTDCLALLSSGKKAVAIPSATILPKDDLYKLRYYRLHMYPDQDEAGSGVFAKLKDFYINHYATIVKETLPQGVKDYSDYYKQSWL